MSHIPADRPVRWGFLGAGGIATSMAADLPHGTNMLYAVAARVWMRANPLILRAREMVADGVIGDVVAVHADFSIGFDFDSGHRLHDLANGGGALLDLGVYPMHFAWLFLGRPDTQQVLGTLSPTRSDATVAIQWGYASGATAQLRCAVTAQTPGRATIAGTAGSITAEPLFLNPERLIVTTSEGESRVDGEQTAYGPQIEEVERCLRGGLHECPLAPHADTIAILELIDQARGDLGVLYPDEG